MAINQKNHNLSACRTWHGHQGEECGIGSIAGTLASVTQLRILPPQKKRRRRTERELEREEPEEERE